jgi:hypothetical protein
MGFLKDLFSGGTSKLVDSVGNVLDNIITTKEEKQELENELRKAELQFNIEMKKLSVEEEKMAYQDIASARDREVKIQTSEYGTKLGKNISPILALSTTILVFIMFYFVVFKPERFANNGSKEIILYIMGVLSAILTQIFSYYFGSSKGSGVKNEMIRDLKNIK